MKFRAEIDVMPHKELLDPQGKAVAQGLQKLDFEEIGEVRVGRHITMRLNAASEKEAKAKVEEACKKLLANAIMEGYTYSIYAE
ncbi:MAG: phosphoribosylformylglycinamidine synthase subunit PurS [Chitinophagales bacterium]